MPNGLASSSAPTLDAPPKEVSAITHGALHYRMTESECVVAFTHETPEAGERTTHLMAFDSISMSKEETARKAVLTALEHIVPLGFHELHIYIGQDRWKPYFDTVRSLIPNIIVISNGTEHEQAIGKDCKLSITKWQNDRQLQREEEAVALIESHPQINPNERSVYVDTHTGSGHRQIGVGYVVRDIVEGTDGNTPAHWKLHFIGTLARATQNGDWTLAALRGIHHALSRFYVISKDIKENRCGLRIHTRDQKAAEIITSLRDGSDEWVDLHPAQREAAVSIVALLKNIKSVELTVIPARSSDPLAVAACRIANATHRHEEQSTPVEARRRSKMKIINNTVQEVENFGYTTSLH